MEARGGSLATPSKQAGGQRPQDETFVVSSFRAVVGESVDLGDGLGHNECMHACMPAKVSVIGGKEVLEVG